MAQAEAATRSFSFSRSWTKWVHIHLLLLVVISAQSVLGGQIVKYLPGYDGELPFKLETGYISVDDSELFYYFIESEGNPQEDPLFLWLTGGPGCTALSGLLYEVGPMEYDISNYTGGLPKLKYYPHARTKTASMIFLDAPVGTGFSYSRTLEGWPSSDTKSSEQSYNFLRKWLVEHPQFLSVHLFIGGDSHAGMIVPLITKKIIDGNKDKAEPYMNIKGYLVGCPMTDLFIDYNSYVQYAHAMALISDEIYENAKRSCKENYTDVDPANSACFGALGDIQKCTKDLNKKHILKPNCDVSSSDPNRRSLEDGASEFLLQPSTVPNPWCTTFGLTHNNIWANDDSVQEALHVRKGTVRQWERCNNSLSYNFNVFSVVSVHKELSRSALEVLVERVQAKAAAATYQMELLTKSCSGTCSWIRWVHIHLLVTLVISAQAVLSGKIVKFLPGYDGELPFKLETGYISVDDSELFYYFLESEGNPQEDPLFLWLTGGPGCSSFTGLIYQAGPMEFDFQNSAGGLPKLKFYPYRWTKAASMIFLDSPVGTGFSYARNPEGWHSSDTKSAEQSYQFLRKWMIEHPQFLSVQLFIAGDSYGGIPVPLITKKIIDGNKDKDKLYLNIKGYLIGSPMTDSSIDTNSKVEFAHGMALISDEIYENARRSCKENYVKVDPENAACSAALGDIQMCVKDLYDMDILKPNCDLFSPEIGEDLDRRSLEEGASEFLQAQSMNPRAWCNDFTLLYSSIWQNDDSVQEALHVRKGTIRHWERCNKSMSYTKDVVSVVSVHKELSRSALEVLVESGDHDMVVPYMGTLKWIKSLNLTLVDNWRPWFIDHQVAGYTMKYSDQGYRLTFATVKGAGHPAPAFYRRECNYLFDRWVNYRPI